jgi:thioredoxin-like negative regulator of GroEL
MAPILGQLAYNGQGVVTVCKVNAQKCSSIASRYDVSGVPAFVLFSNGHMLDSTSGARSIDELRAWLLQNNVSVPEKVSNNGIQL